ncbi:hypothetical protein BXZ70DRAFT_937497 [Cristinia sonorae]|uniref:RING-type domain-containing protein n=1 Tax=Cristinia sonorae TaxID=1940300 RepID=A0A8K0UP52_9AGAR|nr:hypothetical protein BXZ70DRAFT_937497 [Cristinia sonorae]
MPNLDAEDEFDAFFNTLDDVDWDTVPGMSQLPAREPGPPLQGGLISTTIAGLEADIASDDYDFPEIDETYLNEVDAIERNNLAATNGPSASTSVQAPQPGPHPSHANGQTLNPTTANATPKKSPKKRGSKKELRPPSPRKRTRLDNPTSRDQTPTKASSRKAKGKLKETHGRDVLNEVKKVLEGFEEELSCPICCDIFACAHLGNPCGHSFCGDCGNNWFQKNRQHPTCPFCRAALASTMPMFPNYAMDSLIDKHVHALAASGAEEWEPSGIKYKEWSTRKEKWKAGAVQRAATSFPPVMWIDSDEEEFFVHRPFVPAPGRGSARAGRGGWDGRRRG